MSFNQKQLTKLWLANPSCHWCGQITQIVRTDDGILPDDAATRDHLFSRLEPERRAGNVEIVLACQKCNHTRGAVVEAELIKRRKTAQQGRPLSKPFATIGDSETAQELKLLRERLYGCS